MTESSRCYADSEKVTVKNKIGSYFKLDVPKSLTISNVIFDGIDSQGALNGMCSGSKLDTCSFDASNNNTISDATPSPCCSTPN